MKKYMKKIIYIVAFLLIIIIFVDRIYEKKKISDGELLKNGEKIVENFDCLDKWEIFDYEKDYLGKKGTSISIVDGGYDGSAVLISGDVLNDARIHKIVEVEPDSYYKLSVMIRANASLIGKGANISALYCDESYSVTGTFDKWLEYIVYVHADEDQTSIDFSLGLGGHSSVSSGYVYFDDFSLEKISKESIPEYEKIITFKPFNNNTEKIEDEKMYENIEKYSKLIFTVVVILLFVYSILIMKKKSKENVNKRKLDKIDYIIIFALTFITAAFSFFKLGDNYAPNSYWKSGSAGEYIVVKFEDGTSIKKVVHNGNIPSSGSYMLWYSDDGENYIPGISIGEAINNETILQKKKSAFFAWKYDDVNINYNYIKVESKEPGWGINELAFFKKNQAGEYEIAKFEVVDSYYTQSSIGIPEMLFDEQDIVPMNYEYMNGTYFDEVYFPSAAYEQLNGMYISEITHPPLGKIIISIGIAIFGMNPFGWRFMGTFFGILLVPLMYLFATKLFKKRRYSVISVFLIMFDFMRFTQTRLATIDSYCVFFVLASYFFMYDYFTNKTSKEINGIGGLNFRNSYRPLLLSGIMFGLGAATKWSCLYAGAGLSLIFFLTKFYEIWQIKREKEKIKKWLSKDFLPTCLWCVLFFIIIPSTIYLLSYIACMPGYPEQNLFEIAINNSKFIFNFHSTLNDTHPYESAWWSWPLNLKGILYFINYNMPGGKCSSIAAMGNPMVWILSSIGVLISLIFTLKDKDRRGLILLIAYSFQYIPWILITRSAFIYAYFIPLPFAILLLVYCMEKIGENVRNRVLKIILTTILIIYLIAVLILFIVFYPAISGMPVNREYLDSLEWISTWTIT